MKEETLSRYLRRIASSVGYACLSRVYRRQEVLYAFLDLFSISLPTFGFFYFLVLAEMERIRLGCTSCHLVLVHGTRKKKGKGSLKEQIAYSPDVLWRLQNIFIPAIALMPSCRQFTLASREDAFLIQTLQAKHIYPRGYRVEAPVEGCRIYALTEAARKGQPIPSIRPTPRAFEFIRQWMDTVPGKRKVITLNLREAPYANLRNSNLAAWAQFARHLDKTVYYPVFVRDTYTALDPLPQELDGFPIFREMPWHLDLRAALYEKSYLNLFVNNGPAVLCILNEKTRYIVLKQLTPGYRNTSVEDLRLKAGLSLGDQWPWANAYQRVVWEGGDDFEILEKEFKEMCGKIENETN
jgi:hypothetical protein